MISAFHVSKLRLVESWGRGIPLILEKAPDTQFSIQAGIFLSTLLRSEEKPKMSEKTAEMSEETADVSEKIIEAIRANDRITIAELAALAHVATRTIERHLKKLQEAGRLRREGPDKGGRWVVRQTGS